jgi:hypothetical protein
MTIRFQLACIGLLVLAVSWPAVADPALASELTPFEVFQSLKGAWAIRAGDNTLPFDMTYDVGSNGTIVTEQFGKELSVFYSDGGSLRTALAACGSRGYWLRADGAVCSESDSAVSLRRSIFPARKHHRVSLRTKPSLRNWGRGRRSRPRRSTSSSRFGSVSVCRTVTNAARAVRRRV